jgi:hypothetical protein
MRWTGASRSPGVRSTTVAKSESLTATPKRGKGLRQTRSPGLVFRSSDLSFHAPVPSTSPWYAWNQEMTPLAASAAHHRHRFPDPCLGRTEAFFRRKLKPTSHFRPPNEPAGEAATPPTRLPRIPAKKCGTNPSSWLNLSQTSGLRPAERTRRRSRHSAKSPCRGFPQRNAERTRLPGSTSAKPAAYVPPNEPVGEGPAPPSRRAGDSRKEMRNEPVFLAQPQPNQRLTSRRTNPSAKPPLRQVAVPGIPAKKCGTNPFSWLNPSQTSGLRPAERTRRRSPRSAKSAVPGMPPNLPSERPGCSPAVSPRIRPTPLLHLVSPDFSLPHPVSRVLYFCRPRV